MAFLGGTSGDGREQARRSWRFGDGLLAMGLVALALVGTSEIWAVIWRIGRHNEEQSHVLLAPFVAAWLFWVRRERLRFCKPGFSPVGPVLIAAGWALAAFGFRGAFDLFWHLGGLIVVLGALVTVVGVEPLRRFAPAFGALLFLLPVPGRIRQQIALPLQESSATVTTFVLDTFGVPITQAGNLMTVNGVDIAVAEACNGMRMVAALLLVTYAFVFSTPMRNSVRIGLVLISPVLALLVNVIRLVPTALWHGYGSERGAGMFHDIAGWAMLGIAAVLLWGILGLLRWLEVPIAPYAIAEDER
ncbi:MAG: exosortase/archaeosortase family protein [Planctomycetota bacterium]